KPPHSIYSEGRWRLGQDLRPRPGHDMAAADAVDVGGEQHHAVRVMPDQIGPDLVCGNDPGVLTRRASRLVRGDGEKGQVLGADARHISSSDEARPAPPLSPVSESRVDGGSSFSLIQQKRWDNRRDAHDAVYDKLCISLHELSRQLLRKRAFENAEQPGCGTPPIIRMPGENEHGRTAWPRKGSDLCQDDADVTVLPEHRFVGNESDATEPRYRLIAGLPDVRTLRKRDPRPRPQAAPKPGGRNSAATTAPDGEAARVANRAGPQRKLPQEGSRLVARSYMSPLGV